MAKKSFNANSPDDANAALITKIEKIIKTHKKSDFRDGDYFEAEATPKFQKAAVELADLIQKQGVEATDPRLVNLAKDVSKFIDQWGELRGSSVGFLFEKGLTGGPGAKNPQNPFSGLKLT